MANESVGGELIVTLTYKDIPNAVAETVERTIELPGSPLIMGDPGTAQHLAGAEPTVDGGAWPMLREAVIPVRDLLPDDLLTNIVNLRRWSAHTMLEIKVEVRCGARIVDGCVYEVPLAAAFEADDSALPLHVATGGGKSAGLAARDYPVQRASEITPDGDPRLGTWWLMDVAEEIGKMGPSLVSWSAWDEGNAELNQATPDLFTDATTTSTTPVGLIAGLPTSYDADQPGWSLASAGHARRLGQSGDRLVLPNAAAIPVRVNVLASCAANTGTLRVQSGPESWVDVEIANSSMSWKTQWGWLRCGQGGDDLRIAQPTFWTSDGDLLSVRAVSIHYEEHGPGV